MWTALTVHPIHALRTTSWHSAIGRFEKTKDRQTDGEHPSNSRRVVDSPILGQSADRQLHIRIDRASGGRSGAGLTIAVLWCLTLRRFYTYLINVAVYAMDRRLCVLFFYTCSTARTRTERYLSCRWRRCAYWFEICYRSRCFRSLCRSWTGAIGWFGTLLLH